MIEKIFLPHQIVVVEFFNKYQLRAMVHFRPRFFNLRQMDGYGDGDGDGDGDKRAGKCAKKKKLESKSASQPASPPPLVKRWSAGRGGLYELYTIYKSQTIVCFFFCFEKERALRPPHNSTFDVRCSMFDVQRSTFDVERFRK